MDLKIRILPVKFCTSFDYDYLPSNFVTCRKTSIEIIWSVEFSIRPMENFWGFSRTVLNRDYFLNQSSKKVFVPVPLWNDAIFEQFGENWIDPHWEILTLRQERKSVIFKQNFIFSTGFFPFLSLFPQFFFDNPSEKKVISIIVSLGKMAFIAQPGQFPQAEQALLADPVPLVRIAEGYTDVRQATPSDPREILVKWKDTHWCVWIFHFFLFSEKLIFKISLKKILCTDILIFAVHK